MPVSEALKAIHAEVCTADLPLKTYREQENYVPVFGEGPHDASLVFVGEAPGATEARTGKPFCGAAGRVLNELLASAGLVRDQVYITNLVKDRPPGNRDPLPEEIDVYGPYLLRQLEAIQPTVIATLGKHSMNYLFSTYGLARELQPISRIHGKPYQITTSWGPVTLIPLYHPAALIYQQSLKDVGKEDMCVVASLQQSL